MEWGSCYLAAPGMERPVRVLQSGVGMRLPPKNIEDEAMRRVIHFKSREFDKPECQRRARAFGFHREETEDKEKVTCKMCLKWLGRWGRGKKDLTMP